MTVFAVIALTDPPRVRQVVSTHFPADHRQVTPTLSLVAADGVTADRLGLSEGRSGAAWSSASAAIKFSVRLLRARHGGASLSCQFSPAIRLVGRRLDQAPPSLCRRLRNGFRQLQLEDPGSHPEVGVEVIC
jgi:hypothetical protein